MNQYTGYLKLILLPEVKCRERLLPVGDSAWLIDNDLHCSTVILADDVSQKVWLSLISTYHGGAYPHDSLSFLASGGKRTNLSRAYIYGRRDDRKFNMTIYNYGYHVQRVKVQQ